jgi:hypothetical protein
MSTHAIVPFSRLDTASAGFLACCAAAAVLVGWMSVSINRERTCTLQEGPSAELCASQTTPGSDAETARLRARIARDPGDANAYVELALADRSAKQDELVDTASTLAPRDPNLLARRADAALKRQDWRGAVPPLIELADKREADVAVKALASLVGIGQWPLLEPYLTPGSRWLPRLLGQMRDAGQPFSAALPLVVRAQERGVLDSETVRGYVRDLKAQGAWADAYALWLSLHGKTLPALFNASFDHAFETDGFDWEVPSAGPPRRAGVVAERRRAEERGGVLELQFTGRAIQLPIVRQYLFIGPGRYRMRGDHRTHQFRMEEGLRWAVRCDKAVVGASPALGETGGLWRRFEFEFTVPPGCPLVASLQLETAPTSDAVLGARGRVSFDAFELEKLD